MTDAFDAFNNAAAEPAAKPEPTRDRWGRYMLPPLNGGQLRPLTRATTIAKTLDDGYHLSLWAQRMAIFGLSRRRDYLALVDSVQDPNSDDGKRTLNDIVSKSKEAVAAGGGASFGTALHAFTEMLALEGTGPNTIAKIPAEYHDDLVAYRRALSEAGIVELPEYIERVTVCEAIGSAGTFDRVVRMPDGTLAIADLKTQKTMEFGGLAIAIQLAEYANADAIYNVATGKFEPMPDVSKDWAYVFHLPVGQKMCKIYTVNLRIGWVAALEAVRVRELRDMKNVIQPYTPGVASAKLGTPVQPSVPLAIDTAPVTPFVNPVAQPSALTTAAAPEIAAINAAGQAAVAQALGLPASGVQVPTQNGHAAWSSAEQANIMLDSKGERIPDEPETERRMAALPGRNPSWDSETALSTMTKAQVQEIARQHGVSDLKRYKAKLIPDITRARAAGVLPEIDGTTSEDAHDAAVQAATDASEAPEVGGAGVPMEPVSAPPQPLANPEIPVTTPEPAPGNPFAAPGGMTTTVMTQADFVASMHAAGSLAELGAVWDRAGVAGQQTAELMAAGTTRRDELVRAGVVPA